MIGWLDDWIKNSIRITLKEIVVLMERRNINRGFRKLKVWNDAIELYCATCQLMAKLPLEFRKTSANSIDAAQSISRNIAEGYCRKSIKGYLRDHVWSVLNMAFSKEDQSSPYTHNQACSVVINNCWKLLFISGLQQPFHYIAFNQFLV